MNVKTNKIYRLLEQNKDKRLLIFQGGARSGKTYNIILWLVVHLIQTPNITLSIVRKTLPSLKGSVLRDLKEILEILNIYDPNRWKKQDGYYELDNGSMIEWFSTDMEQKVRGRKRDILFINEANELSQDEYTQLAIRTTDKIIIDYNPSDLYSYLYDLPETEDNVFYCETTYKDNPFLTREIIHEIETLKDKDKNLWRVFGLGQRGVATNTVFTTFNLLDEKDFPDDGGIVVRGIDFGYNDPSAIVEVRKIDDKLYVKELLYSSNLTSIDLAYRIKNMGIDVTDNFWCDSARPEVIEDLKREGINAKPVKKSPILHGIDLIKRHVVYIHKDSENLIKEFNNYKWKTDKDKKIIDVPEDMNNHAIDAFRYAITMVDKEEKQGEYFIL